MEILEKLYDMTAFGELAANPWTLLMLSLSFVLLYLGIVKKYEPLLLIPIAFWGIAGQFSRWKYECDPLRRGQWHHAPHFGRNR